eukprot:s2580_g7.t1
MASTSPPNVADVRKYVGEMLLQRGAAGHTNDYKAALSTTASKAAPPKTAPPDKRKPREPAHPPPEASRRYFTSKQSLQHYEL